LDVAPVVDAKIFALNPLDLETGGRVRDILMGLKARDTWALEALYDVYGRRAYSLAYRIVGDHGAAEDAVQEAYLDLWQHADRLNPSRGTLESLLLTVVHHRAIDRLRKMRGQTRLYAGVDVEQIQDSQPIDADMASLAVDRHYVQEALHELPAEQSRAVELAYFSGYTQAEIASIMKVPLGTVKSRLRLALERLRTILIERETSDLPAGR
jgi:RNA polymerase sigma-70 factor (ECF subfamily)